MRPAARKTFPLTSVEGRYLDLLKNVLTRYGFGDDYLPFHFPKHPLRRLPFFAISAFNRISDPTACRW